MPAMKKSFRANWKHTGRGAIAATFAIGSSGASARM
jgi:hypothetical protein